MQTADELKQAICRAIDEGRERTFATAEAILRNPELGFKESKTAATVASRFTELGIPHRTGLAITGVKAVLEGARPGPTVALLGELDALKVEGHPFADPDTSAAHACGHQAQISSLLAVAEALVKTRVMESLAGRVVLMAVPAEEYVEMEYRRGLRRAGKLEFLSGKPELVRLGEFDDVDMAMMPHADTDPAHGAVSLGTMNGCTVKLAEFYGRAAHAGGAPWRGINALNAASLALQAMHAQRETFRDEDCQRIHFIITRGGDLVNVVPAFVSMEGYARGRTIEALRDAEAKVDRSLRAGAVAVGARLRIETIPGYLPLLADPLMCEVFRANAAELVGDEGWGGLHHHSGSTDMGDLSHIMPVIHPFFGGCGGTSHGADFCVTDTEAAYLTPAKSLAMTLVDLLAGDAAVARQVLMQSKPPFTKEEYLATMRKAFGVEEYQG